MSEIRHPACQTKGNKHVKTRYLTAMISVITLFLLVACDPGKGNYNTDTAAACGSDIDCTFGDHGQQNQGTAIEESNSFDSCRSSGLIYKFQVAGYKSGSSVAAWGAVPLNGVMQVHNLSDGTYTTADYPDDLVQITDGVDTLGGAYLNLHVPTNTNLTCGGSLNLDQDGGDLNGNSSSGTMDGDAFWTFDEDDPNKSYVDWTRFPSTTFEKDINGNGSIEHTEEHFSCLHLTEEAGAPSDAWDMYRTSFVSSVNTDSWIAQGNNLDCSNQEEPDTGDTGGDSGDTANAESQHYEDKKPVEWLNLAWPVIDTMASAGPAAQKNAAAQWIEIHIPYDDQPYFEHLAVMAINGYHGGEPTDPMNVLANNTIILLDYWWDDETQQMQAPSQLQMHAMVSGIRRTFLAVAWQLGYGPG